MLYVALILRVWFLKKWCAGCGVGDGVPWGVAFAAVRSGAQLAVRGGAQLAVRGGVRVAVQEEEVTRGGAVRGTRWARQRGTTAAVIGRPPHYE
jgi:hypothetical protein